MGLKSVLGKNDPKDIYEIGCLKIFSYGVFCYFCQRMNSKQRFGPELDAEIQYRTSRSSGPGGQNVNKVNSKVELRFDPGHSQILTGVQRQRLLLRWQERLTDSGWIILTEQQERSQWMNKKRVKDRFYALVEEGLKPVRKRRPTRPTKASAERRRQTKKINSEKKARRRSPES